MTANKPDLDRSRSDPDDAPELDDAMLEHFSRHAAIMHGDTVIREATGTLTRTFGRPKLENPKQLVSIRLDKAVLERLRASGKSWQSRVNELLRREVGI